MFKPVSINTQSLQHKKTKCQTWSWCSGYSVVTPPTDEHQGGTSI